MSHKYTLGQVVMFTPARDEIAATTTSGKITRLLPKEGPDYQYHVQLGSDGQLRRARESQLRPITVPADRTVPA